MSPRACELGLPEKYMVLDVIYSASDNVLTSIPAFSSDSNHMC